MLERKTVHADSPDALMRRVNRLRSQGWMLVGELVFKDTGCYHKMARQIKKVKIKQHEH